MHSRKFSLPLAFMATVVLVACGRVGGDDDSAPSLQGPPPTTTPPASAPTNQPPVANAGPDLIVELPTDSAPLAGSATDDALPTSTLTYSWTLVSGPLGPNSSPGVVFANPASAATTARFAGGVGEYTLNLDASDGALTGRAVLRVSVKPNPHLYPGPTAGGWPTATPADEQMVESRLDEARNYSQTSSLGQPESGIVVRHGRVVYQWGSQTRRYEMKSTTKSMGGLAFLLALDEGTLALPDKAVDRLPLFGAEPPVDTSPVSTGSLGEITLLQLATHTSGLSKSDERATLQLLYTPGTTWSYSDQGLNWLADTLTQTYAQDLNAFLFGRIFQTLQISAADLTWRDNAFRPGTMSVNGPSIARREFASGINANVNAMARVGLLMLRKGVWGNNLLLSNAIVAKAHEPQPEIASAAIANAAGFPAATTSYGLLWWTNAAGQMPGVPRDTFWAWGLHDTLIIVVPSLDLVIARAGTRGWRVQEEFWNADFAALAPFITPIVESATP